MRLWRRLGCAAKRGTVEQFLVSASPHMIRLVHIGKLFEETVSVDFEQLLSIFQDTGQRRGRRLSGNFETITLSRGYHHDDIIQDGGKTGIKLKSLNLTFCFKDFK